MTSESGSGDDPTDAPSWPEAEERRRWPREPAAGKESRPSGPPALVPLRFSTGELPTAAQFAAWRAHMAPLLEVRLPDGVSPDQGFPAEQTGWRLNGLLIIQQRTPAHSYARSRAMLRSSPIDHWNLGILRSGRAWTEVDRRVTETAPGDLFLRSLGYPYRGRTTEAAGVFLFMSYELLADDAGILEVANNSVLSGSLADLLLNYINGIEASLGVLRSEELPRIVQTIRDMVVSCVAASVTPNPAGSETNKGMMERAHRYIHLHLNSAELTPDAICRAIGISRTRLYQLFEQSGGVLNYIRKRRLQHAYAALSDPTDTRSIAEIAEAAGFEVAANFTRAFSHEFGVSPREIRKAAATHRPILAVTLARRHRGATIGDWLDPPGK
ncbi:helix-turn-helix domain-containing protein [Ensifer sp. LCM 4579]|uniref:helix-turn-helix domain-containing protein n=1 Tax=Ensifer sp. LCM 4579 TaxID=1848292 RepID=UPI0008DAF8A0|nr:AraC family transcriptional regulator [Ensifer sp. LCM 4579]OHV72812.1 AraC family transcriptional regulator [Ensifer sp. LCM 4579]